MHRWEELMDTCLQEDEVRGLNAKTIAVRRRELARCGVWLGGRRPKPTLESVDEEILIGYIRSRSIFKSKSTIASIVSTLRRMGDHLVVSGVWRKNPMRWIRGPKIDMRSRLPRRVGGPDLQSLWQAVKAIPSRNRRDKWLAVLALLYGTGMRRCQIVALDIDDLDLTDGTVRIKAAKGGLDNAVPIARELCEILSSYLEGRKKVVAKDGFAEKKALFVSNRGCRQSGQSLSSGLKKLRLRAGLGRITMHQFRHTCASDLLERGVTLPQVQRILGHSGIGSTMWYLSVSDKSRKEAIAKHPINDMLEGKA